jgi:hypothetical protein
MLEFKDSRVRVYAAKRMAQRKSQDEKTRRSLDERIK